MAQVATTASDEKSCRFAALPRQTIDKIPDRFSHNPRWKAIPGRR